MSAVTSGASAEDLDALDVWADPAKERIGTSATVITFVRTVLSVVLSGIAASQHDLTLLVVALVVYWAGDSLDGFVARIRGCETRTGAVLDILSDRFCAAAFYFGLVWLHTEFVLPVLIYLAEFMVVDCFLSLAFLAWPVRSPNYFYVVDRTIWLWNWSKPGKAVNSSLFAVLLLVTGWAWVGVVIATALLLLKCLSLVRLGRIGLPIPAR
jgi:CDP-diacylglycerol---glycerol-3-phosphate 3-phosphatidyltransferase